MENNNLESNDINLQTENDKSVTGNNENEKKNNTWVSRTRSYELKDWQVKLAEESQMPNLIEYNIAAEALKSILKYNEPIQKISTLEGNNEIAREARRLTGLALERKEEIDYLLKKLQIMNNEKIDLWQFKIYVAEMLWGNQMVHSKTPIVMSVKNYEQDLRELFVEVSTVIKNPIDIDKSLFPTYVRINVLTNSIEDCLSVFAKEGWNLLPNCETYLDHMKQVESLEGKNFIKDFHIPELFVFPPGTSFYEHPDYLGGKFLIQDKGSCLSSFLLDPKPGSAVLDVFAAIGHTTNHLANIIKNQGTIYANDIHTDRLQKLSTLMELTNVKCVKTSNTSYSLLNYLFGIEYVLIDPCCTYTGLFLGANKTKQLHRIRRNKDGQTGILRYILRTFQNVKRVVYSVCSIYPEEGKDIINQILFEFGGSYTLVDVKQKLRNDWQSFSQTCSNKCLQIVPELDLCQGYFIAVLERNFNIPVPMSKSRKRKLRMATSADEDVKRLKIENQERTLKFVETVEQTVIQPTEQTLVKMPVKRKRHRKRDNKKMQAQRPIESGMEQLLKLTSQDSNQSVHISMIDNDIHEEILETTHSQLYP